MFISLQSGRKRGMLRFNVANIETYGPADETGNSVQITMSSGATHQIPTTMEFVDKLITRVRGVSIVELNETQPAPEPAEPEDPDPTHSSASSSASSAS